MPQNASCFRQNPHVVIVDVRAYDIVGSSDELRTVITRCSFLRPTCELWRVIFRGFSLGALALLLPLSLPRRDETFDLPKHHEFPRTQIIEAGVRSAVAVNLGRGREI